MASEEDLARLRAAAVAMALEGKVKEAENIAKLHDAVKDDDDKKKGN